MMRSTVFLSYRYGTPIIGQFLADFPFRSLAMVFPEHWVSLAEFCESHFVFSLFAECAPNSFHCFILKFNELELYLHINITFSDNKWQE